jgi:hypothetical protein
MNTKFTAMSIKVGRGTAVHYAWKTDRNGKEIEYPHAFCGADGTGSAQVRRFDPMVTGITDQPVTCKKCLKAMEYAQSIFEKEASNEN